MKILYVLDTYPIFSETFIRDEIEELKLQGHEIIITTFTYGDKEFPLKECLKPSFVLNETSFSTVKSLCTLIKKINKFSFSFKQKNIPKKEIIYHSIKIAEIAKNLKVDHIHSHFGLNAASFAIQAAKILDIPSSFTVHGYDINKVNVDIAEKVEYTDKVISVSSFLKEEMIKKNNLNEKNASKIKIIPFGVKSLNFPKVERNQRYLFVGRFNKVKGIEHILEIWKKNKELPWIDLIGFGTPEEESEIAKMIINDGLKIRILGKKTSEEIHKAMLLYKAIILPFQINKKTGERDTGAIVAKEAMINQIPIITTDLIPHIVSNKEGYIAKMGNAEDLLKKIKDFQYDRQNANNFSHFANNNELESKIKNAHLKILNNYSIKKQIKEFTLCLKEI